LRELAVIVGVGLLSIGGIGVAGVAGSPTNGAAAGTTGASGSSGALGSTGTGGATGGRASHGGGSVSSGVLCAGLLGSGILGNVFTVAPMPAAQRSDPNTAIQFTQIWSNTHQATVGGRPPDGVPHAKPAVATVKLPIAFSAADRRRFEAAGWTARAAAGGHGTQYCLQNSAGDGATPSQGMICVSAVD
jgi:hypothetical protein